MEDPPAGNSERGSNVPSREEFNTAIVDLSAKLESLVMTMSQVVHGTAPAATDNGGESRGGRHTAPGAVQQGLHQAPNPGGTSDLQRHREESASSVGDVSRESAHGIIGGLACWRQEPVHPTMPHADCLESGVCWGHGRV